MRLDAAMRRGLVALVFATTVAAGVSHAVPIDGGVEGPTPDVFYNFYVPPVPPPGYPGMGAQLYVAPRPVPPRVGHTWYTYPPFMPHEFLYHHHKHFHQLRCQHHHQNHHYHQNYLQKHHLVCHPFHHQLQSNY